MTKVRLQNIRFYIELLLEIFFIVMTDYRSNVFTCVLLIFYHNNCFFIFLYFLGGYQPQALIVKSLGVHVRVARVVVEVKEVLVEVVVVVIQYNKNLPSRSSALSLTPDSNISSSALKSMMKWYI